MKEERIVVEYDTIYIAEDGTQWNIAEYCQQYEELLKDPSPLKALKFFDRDGNPLDIFALGEIPEFCHLVIEDSEIKHYHWSVIKAIIGDKGDYHKESYILPNRKGIYYNEWAGAYNGDYYARVGWKEQKSFEWLEEEIKHCQKEIELYKKMNTYLKK